MFQTRKQHIISKLLPDEPIPPPSKISLKTSALRNCLSHPLLSSLNSKFSTNQSELSLHHYRQTIAKITDLASSFEFGSPELKPKHRKVDTEDFVVWRAESGNVEGQVKDKQAGRKTRDKRGVLGSRDLEKISLRNLLQGKRRQLAMAGKITVKLKKAGEGVEHKGSNC